MLNLDTPKIWYILVEQSTGNGDRIVKSLNEFGFKSLKLSEQDFCRKDTIIQLGYEPIRIDIITSIQGITFKQAWKNKVAGVYGNEKVFFIGIEELIKNKKSSQRKQDMVDLDILLSARSKRRK